MAESERRRERRWKMVGRRAINIHGGGGQSCYGRNRGKEEWEEREREGEMLGHMALPHSALLNINLKF